MERLLQQKNRKKKSYYITWKYPKHILVIQHWEQTEVQLLFKVCMLIVVCSVEGGLFWANLYIFFSPQLQQFRFQDTFRLFNLQKSELTFAKRVQRSHSFRWEQLKTFWTGNREKVTCPPGWTLLSHKRLCEHFLRGFLGECVPAGNLPLTSRGQRACPSAAPPAAWDRSPAARRADEQRGWPAGWRRAVRGSPAKTGSDYGGLHSPQAFTATFWFFVSVLCMEKPPAALYIPLVCCVQGSSERMLCHWLHDGGM